MITTCGSIYRSDDNVNQYSDYYKNHKPSENCVFCSGDKSTIELEDLNLSHLRVINNSFPYDFWDMKKVEDHLMAVPRRHLNCPAKLNAEELAELNKIMTYFADKNYDIFVRNSGSKLKSIEHLHFHLIKTKESKLNVKVEYSD